MFSIMGIIAGGFASVQTAVNSRLRTALGSPYRSSFVSFFIGTLFLIAINLVTGTGLFLSGHQIATIPWWAYIGGITGTIGLTMNIILFAHLGSTQTAILPIVGQLITGSLIDQFGWFNMSRNALNIMKLIGLILVLLGACGIVIRPKENDKQISSQKRKGDQLLWQVLAILTGALIAIQTTTNGQLGKGVGSPIKGSMITFSMGSIILLIIVLVQTIFSDQSIGKIQKSPWWSYLGGPLGAANVVLGAWLIPIVGAGLIISLQLLGMMVISLLIDHFGLFESEKRSIRWIQLVGLLVLLVGVALVELKL